MSKEDLILKVIVPAASAVILLLLILLAFIVRKLIKKTSRDKIVHDLFEKVSADKLNKFNSEVSRINVIANSNPKYDRLSEDLRNLFDKLDDTYTIANKIVSEINGSQEDGSFFKDKYHLSKRDFKFKVEEVQDRIEHIKNLEAEFELIASQISHQDEFLKSEFTLFQTNLRKAIEVYKTKRLLLDKVSKKIDEIITIIKQQESLFNEAVLSGNMKEASETLKNYSRLVVKFAEIINEGPSIQTYIYDIIPKSIKKIVDNYNECKNDLLASKEIINFDGAIKNAAIIYQEAKVEYGKLNISKAKDLIKKILKSVKATEKIINLEIRSRKAVLNSFKDINNEVKISLRRYVDLKEQIRSYVGKGVQVPMEINDLFIQVKTLGKDIDEKAIKFSEMIADVNIPFSSKMHRSKILVQATTEFTIKINEILQLLWVVNIDASILRNKFKQVEAAINELISNIKRQNILLSLEDQANINSLSEKIDILANKIKTDSIPKEVSNEVSLLVTNTVSLYKTISSKIQISEMVANVIREFSPRRALSEKINYSLIQAEKLYLDGKYAEALNVVVTELESGKNNVFKNSN